MTYGGRSLPSPFPSPIPLPSTHLLPHPNPTYGEQSPAATVTQPRARAKRRSFRPGLPCKGHRGRGSETHALGQRPT
jgi:hypothetical protein